MHSSLSWRCEWWNPTLPSPRPHPHLILAPLQSRLISRERGGRRWVRQKEEKSWWRGYLQYSPSNAWKNSNSNCACNVRTNWTMLRSANNLLTSISDKHIPSLADLQREMRMQSIKRLEPKPFEIFMCHPNSSLPSLTVRSRVWCSLITLALFLYFRIPSKEMFFSRSNHRKNLYLSLY